MSAVPWGGHDSEIAQAVEQYSRERLAAYREAPRDIEEHANLERAAVEGGYGRRQLFELVQNGADELRRVCRARAGGAHRGCAVLRQRRPATVSRWRRGAPSSHLSSKTGVEIGRFGLGFKSVLAITTRPEVFSRSGSLRFDPGEVRRLIHEIVPSAIRTPVLRIAMSIDAEAEAADDPFLADLMTWATTIVRLPGDTADSSWLGDDIKRFPSQFLLFSPHVERLGFDDQESNAKRTITASRDGDEVVLDDGARVTLARLRRRTRTFWPGETRRRSDGRS